MISHEPPPGAVAPLWTTVAETYHTLAGNIRALAKMIVVPTGLGMGIIFVAPLLASPWLDVVLHFLFLLGWTLLGVSWLRLLLLEDKRVSRLFPRLTRRHLRFAGYALLLSVLDLPLLFGWHYLADQVASGPLSELVYWLTYVFLGFIRLRFAFVYPATAVDERYGLMLAWRHSQSAALPLFGIFLIIVVAPFAALSYGLNALMASDHLPYLWWSLWHVGIWIIEAAYATIIAVAFRRVTGWVPAPDKEVLERFD